MTDLDALLRRDGLAAATRLLLLCAIRTANADWAGLEDVVHAARRHGSARAELEETLLQGVLFFGFPRSVTAFECLARAWPAETAPAGGDLPRDTWRAAGERLFDAIYGRNAASVHALLRGFHAAFHDFVIESAYGRVLCRPGLDPVRRELIAVAALAALDQVPQLVAHGRGARHLGADDAEVREALVTALGDGPDAAALLRRIVARTRGAD